MYLLYENCFKENKTKQNKQNKDWLEKIPRVFFTKRTYFPNAYFKYKSVHFLIKTNLTIAKTTLKVNSLLFKSSCKIQKICNLKFNFFKKE